MAPGRRGARNVTPDPIQKLSFGPPAPIGVTYKGGRPKMRRTLAALTMATLGLTAHAADQIRIGFMSTLSGPSAALGLDIRDAFNLVVRNNGGKLGGLPAEVIVVDDQMNPDTGKQLTARLLKKDRVDVVTGIVFSNVMLAIAPSILENQTFLVSANAGPGAFSGEGCNPYFYVASWQNDGYHEAAGQHANNKGLKNVLPARAQLPCRQGRADGLQALLQGQGRSRRSTPKLGQLDFAAELAQVRAAKPDAVYIFLPGGMGINFIKQFVAAGLDKQMHADRPGLLGRRGRHPAVGEPMLGMFNTAHWAHDLDNLENKHLRRRLPEGLRRTPTVYAAQGYDTALLIDAAVRAVKGKVEDKAACGKALASANFKSVRGEFKINVNHAPIQNYYLASDLEGRQGRITNKFARHGVHEPRGCVRQRTASLGASS
jgi:branched-chain amino acid transport system substrate-binding protein